MPSQRRGRTIWPASAVQLRWLAASIQVGRRCDDAEIPVLTPIAERLEAMVN